MALQLGDLVVSGEIDNSRDYSVSGWLRLRGRDDPILLDLTGNCAPDLLGRRIRFQPAPAEEMETGQTVQRADDKSVSFDLSSIAAQQIGPTGTMTATDKARIPDTPQREAGQTNHLDEPPVAIEKPSLHLEWFSQNGRVVVEIEDPVLEFVETGDTDPAATDPRGPSAGLDQQPYTDEDDDFDPFEDAQSDELDAEPDFRLIPDFLQDQLDDDAAATDDAIRGSLPAGDLFEADETEKPQAVRELELMDDLIEQGPGVPLDELFDGPLRLPRPENLAEDADAEPALKTLLAELALYGVCLHVCEHFTPADTYRLLIEEICPEATAYRELRGTGWVQHYMTSEFCPLCEAEFDREFEESQRRANEDQPPDEGPPTDDAG